MPDLEDIIAEDNIFGGKIMILSATLNQMAFLFSLIIAGYVLVRLKLLPDGAESVLSKLENYLFIPCLVLGTFIGNFTPAKLGSAGKLILFSVGIEVVVVAVSLLLTRLITKDKYVRNIYLYGLCFSNFGFMGNAVVSALFPDVFLEYIIFTLVLWILIYIWGVPALLRDSDKGGAKAIVKNLINPMFICMILGIIIGLTGFTLPSFAVSLIDSVGGCMSPIAMLITGMTIAKANIGRILKIKSVYLVSIIRLVVYPMIFIGIYLLLGLELSKSFLVCAVASLAMPLGLNTIVIPNAYGKDTTVASGMALISHVLSVISIPLIFTFIS